MTPLEDLQCDVEPENTGRGCDEPVGFPAMAADSLPFSSVSWLQSGLKAADAQPDGPSCGPVRTGSFALQKPQRTVRWEQRRFHVRLTALTKYGLPPCHIWDCTSRGSLYKTGMLIEET